MYNSFEIFFNKYSLIQEDSKVLITGNFNLDIKIQAVLANMMQDVGVHLKISEPAHELALTNPHYCVLYNTPVWFCDYHIITLQMN